MFMPAPVGATSNAPLSTWTGWWLATRCRCRSAFLSCSMLAEEHGDLTVQQMAARLRCRRCGEIPSVQLVDRLREQGQRSIPVALAPRREARRAAAPRRAGLRGAGAAPTTQPAMR